MSIAYNLMGDYRNVTVKCVQHEEWIKGTDNEYIILKKQLIFQVLGVGAQVSSTSYVVLQYSDL